MFQDLAEVSLRANRISECLCNVPGASHYNSFVPTHSPALIYNRAWACHRDDIAWPKNLQPPRIRKLDEALDRDMTVVSSLNEEWLLKLEIETVISRFPYTLKTSI